MKIATLALLLFALAQAGVAARAEERALWRLGAPQRIWTNETPRGQDRFGDAPCFIGPDADAYSEDRARSTIVVHPHGGVLAVTQRARLAIAVSRVGSDGRLLWQTQATLNTGGWDAEPHAHVSLDDRGNAIIALPSSLIGVRGNGALWMQRAPGELGFARFGMILRDHAAPRQILVGGWGVAEEWERRQAASEQRQIEHVPVSDRIIASGQMEPFVPRVAIAALDDAGTRLWAARFPPLDRTAIAVLRTGPIPAGETPWARAQREALEARRAGQYVQTISVPLQVLDGGAGRGVGGVFLLGCGRLGAHVPPSPDDEHPRPPCHPAQSARLVLVDSEGAVLRQPLVGEPLRGEPENRLQVPRHALIDAPLRACVSDASQMPTVLWFGRGGGAIRDLLVRLAFWDAASGYMSYGGADSAWLHVPAWDAATLGGRDYVLFGRFIPSNDGALARLRMRIVLVRMDGDRPSVLIDRMIAPLARLRLALGERALYGLSGDRPDRLLRFPIRPAPGDLPARAYRGR